MLLVKHRSGIGIVSPVALTRPLRAYLSILRAEMISEAEITAKNIKG